MSCKFYYFYCGDYHCGKCDKDVKDDWYKKYCRDYNYDECPVFKGYIEEPANDEDESHSSSTCFLTSACVSAKGLPDDCYELQTLRIFRDNWLSKTENGNAAISHYYIVAPKIVDAINHSSDSNAIYDIIYTDVVLPCVRFIENERYEEAFNLYKEAVLKFELEYSLSSI